MCSVLMPLNIQRTFIELFMQLKFIMRMPKMAHCCWVFRRQRNLPERNSMTIYVCIKCTYRHILTLFQRNLFQCNSTKKGNHKFSTKKIPCKYRQFVSLLNFPWNEPPSCCWVVLGTKELGHEKDSHAWCFSMSQMIVEEFRVILCKSKRKKKLAEFR